MGSASVKPAVFVLLTLWLSAPTIGNILKGAVSAVGAGEHIGAAIIISWLAVSLVGHIIDSYRAAVFRRSAKEWEESRRQHSMPHPVNETQTPEAQ